MANIFFCSDHHFHHSGILTFMRNDGVTPLRVFDSVQHMNEWMVYCHNRVVKPNDKVYFLGDVTMSRSAESLEILGRMNGEKVLIKGNHDQHKAAQYLKYFKDIRGVDPHISGFVLSHVPLHPDCLARWGTNIHGHLHSNVVLRELSKIPDPRYVSACMEQINYTPISLDEIKSKVR